MSGEVTGVVDWDLGVPQGLALFDLIHLLASTRQERLEETTGGFVCLSRAYIEVLEELAAGPPSSVPRDLLRRYVAALALSLPYVSAALTVYLFYRIRSKALVGDGNIESMLDNLDECVARARRLDVGSVLA